LVRPHKDPFINNLHHRVPEKSLPAMVSRPPSPAMQTGIAFQGGPFHFSISPKFHLLGWNAEILAFLRTIMLIYRRRPGMPARKKGNQP
jgi:hypothetical protein